jgi:L-ascorbate metabolism protein UlaG (beta-lactamase superfamily)
VLKERVESRVRWRVTAIPAARWTDAHIEPGQVALWWLGHAGFAIRSASRRILIDPYLSDSLALRNRGRVRPHVRRVPPPLAPESIRSLDALLCTHAHPGHMDPGTLPAIALWSPRCRFVIPRAVLATALARGAPATETVTLNDGESVWLTDDIRVEAIPAAHDEISIDARGEHRFLGYVLSVDGLTLYHSGDCVPYPGLAERLAGRSVSAALLPVSGRDERQRAAGAPGNFHLEEAVRLAEELAIPVLVPHHFGVFDADAVDPSVLEARAARPARTRLLVPDLDHGLLLQRD